MDDLPLGWANRVSTWDIFRALQVDGCLSLEAQREQRQGFRSKKVNTLHQLMWKISHYLQGFIHPRWCRISSINSILAKTETNHTPPKKTLPIVSSVTHQLMTLMMEGWSVSLGSGWFFQVGDLCGQKFVLVFAAKKSPFLDLQDAILRKLVDGREVGGSPMQLRCIFSVGPKKIGQKVWRYPLVS